MKLSWTSGVKDAEHAKDIERVFQASRVVRTRLVVMLEDMINASMINSRSKDRYQITNWALDQADSRGYERALQDVIKLLVDKTEKNQ